MATKRRIHERVPKLKITGDGQELFLKYLHEYDEIVNKYLRPQKVRFKKSLKPFKRKRRLLPSEINPILVIFSPRDIDFVKEAYNKIDFIDKVWFKYYIKKDVIVECFKFLRKHPEYTHIMLCSDDVVISPYMIKRLLKNVLEYDFPAISGCCNYCDMYLHKSHDCSWCIKNEDHPLINVTFEVFKHWDAPLLINKETDIQLVTEEWRQEHPIIKQVWYQGFLLSIIRRDIFLKHGLKPTFLAVRKGKKIYNYSSDFSFAVECHKHAIPQFVDFRVHARHFGVYHTGVQMQYGKRKSEIVHECSSPEKLKVALAGKLSRILICTPINNESHSIKQHVKSLLEIDYPKELIDLIWFENGSVDGTWRTLKRYHKKIKGKYNYNSFRLIRGDFGLKRLGKITLEDFAVNGNPRAGKCYLKNRRDAMARGARLTAIYNFFFESLSHDYLMILHADVVVPRDIVKRYLEVFRECKDAGWVGGVHHKRYPLHLRRGRLARRGGLAGPIMIKENFWRYTTDEEIIKLRNEGKIVFECGMTGHAWMLKSSIIRNGARFGPSPVEIGAPFIEKMWSMGLKVYCTSDVYLKHISLDGKIHRHSIYDEIGIEEEQLKPKEKISNSEKHVTPLIAWEKSMGIYELVIREIKEKEKTTKRKERVEKRRKRPDEKPKSKKAIKSELKEESKLKIYHQFIRGQFPKIIPPRPRDNGEMVMDRISKNILTQKDWDRLYGKWRRFIEREHNE